MNDPQIMGHRGARFEAPENTVSGFRHAVELGLEAVELDVRLTADGALVIIHDASVDRTCDGSGYVADLSLAEIGALDARSNFPDWAEPCRVPTLSAALDALDGMRVVEIEIKNDEPSRIARLVPMVIEEIRRRRVEDRVIVTSFSADALRLVQEQAPDLRRCFIGDWDSPDFLDTARSLGCVRAGVHHPTADPVVVREAREQGLQVVCWPVNTAEALESALRFEPDVLCTDHPSHIRTLMAERASAT